MIEVADRQICIGCRPNKGEIPGCQFGCGRLVLFFVDGVINMTGYASVDVDPSQSFPLLSLITLHVSIPLTSKVDVRLSPELASAPIVLELIAEVIGKT